MNPFNIISLNNPYKLLMYIDKLIFASSTPKTFIQAVPLKDT